MYKKFERYICRVSALHTVEAIDPVAETLSDMQDRINRNQPELADKMEKIRSLLGDLKGELCLSYGVEKHEDGYYYNKKED